MWLHGWFWLASKSTPNITLYTDCICWKLTHNVFLQLFYSNIYISINSLKILLKKEYINFSDDWLQQIRIRMHKNVEAKNHSAPKKGAFGNLLYFSNSGLLSEGRHKIHPLDLTCRFWWPKLDIFDQSRRFWRKGGRAIV